MSLRFDSRKIVACAALGAVFFSLPLAGEARRMHDPQISARVESQQTLQEGHTRNLTREAASQRKQASAKGSLQERIQAILHEQPAKPKESAIEVRQTLSADDKNILGTPLASQQQCLNYLLSVNPRPNITVTPEQLISYYYEEGGREGVRPDVAFAQALKETGFFRYGGDVVPEQNNYCGLGTTGGGVKGAYFASSQQGVRAHIQHLLAYASTRKPVEPVVDPRYALVRSSYGKRTLDTWEDLNGRWAVPGYTYGQSIMSMFKDMLRY